MLLAKCVWNDSCLRTKSVLIHSLKDHENLFCRTLGVPDADSKMYFKELKMKVEDMNAMADVDTYNYVKQLLIGIASLPKTATMLAWLKSEKCWPYRTAKGSGKLRSMEQDFYINDSQQLFDIFFETHPCLDFDVQSSNTLKPLLEKFGCRNHLSKCVTMEAEPYKLLRANDTFTRDLRARTGALMRYANDEMSRKLGS